MPLKPGDHVNVYVKYVLSCSFAVLLDYAYAVSVGGFFDYKRYQFGDFVHLSKLFFRDVKDVNVVRFRDNKRVPHV